MKEGKAGNRRQVWSGEPGRVRQVTGSRCRRVRGENQTGERTRLAGKKQVWTGEKESSHR